MKPRHPSFVAYLIALLLVFAQQAAVTHMIGHGLGHRGAEARESIKQGEDNHGAALTLSHVCTTCIAFSALDAFVPSVTLPTLPTPLIPALFVAIALACFSQRPVTARARAPPSSL